MRWKNEYEPDIAIIATRHKQLFRFNEELQSTKREGFKPSNIEELLNQLTSSNSSIASRKSSCRTALKKIDKPSVMTNYSTAS
ncbi:MAG: hypothetical protein KKD01_15550 [Proteobacteria bacterium]|nr:hypothetical protein [Pseudomonadota bacterium]MBU1456139.1 hypothetical protein [Pseudomonadota bacterium]